ncbi:MAG: AAA family ATPase, partial [Pseudomonadota bacterium]
MSASTSAKNIETQIEKTAQKLNDAKAEIGKVVFGQNTVVDQTLITLMAGGHVLLIGVPGLAKTLLVETVADVFGLS